MADKIEMINQSHDDLSLRSRCQLLSVNRSSIYYVPVAKTNSDLDLVNEIHDIWLATPFYGYRKITAVLKRCGHQVNHKKVQRLMRQIGIEAIYPKPNTSKAHGAHKIYPYLLKDVIIERPNQVFSTDITYLKLKQGFMYLVAILDIFSRYILSWRLSNTLDTVFCLEALDDAFAIAVPDVFNTDQGSQFTSEDWTDRLKADKVQISMDGKGCFWDNIHIERLWRTIKYEEVYISDYDSVEDAESSLEDYVEFYNYKRPHQSLNYLTPAEVYQQTPCS